MFGLQALAFLLLKLVFSVFQKFLVRLRSKRLFYLILAVVRRFHLMHPLYKVDLVLLHLGPVHAKLVLYLLLLHVQHLQNIIF